MDELLEILNNIRDDIDYENTTDLISGKIFDSLKIVMLIGAISDEFDIELGPEHLIPENFNSAAAMWDMICRIQDEE